MQVPRDRRWGLVHLLVASVGRIQPSRPRPRPDRLERFFDCTMRAGAPTMAIRVQCSNPDCRDSFYVSEAEIGLTVRCEECGQRFSLTPTLDPGDPPPSGAGPGWNPTD